MTTLIPLTDTVLLIVCPACKYSGCAGCKFTGRVPFDPYRRGGGEQGDDFEDVPRAASVALTPLEQALRDHCDRGAPFDERHNGVTGEEVDRG